jgi:hypothetical protein
LKKVIVCALSLGALIVPSAALASGNSKPQTQLTVGNCISDVVYGNEPNMANGAPGGPAEQEPGTNGGNVVPTQSPGPFVNNPADPDNPTRGRSVGQFQQDGINIPELCRTAIGK